MATSSTRTSTCASTTRTSPLTRWPARSSSGSTWPSVRSVREGICLRVVIFSDTHGNLTALTAGLTAAKQLAPDVLLCAGDIAQFGPQPNECISLLAEASIPSVRGNHDRDLLAPLTLPPEATPRQRGLAAIHNWGHERLSAESRAFLAGLPLTWRTEPAPGHALLVVHASPDRDDEIVPNAEALARCKRAGAAAVVAGHLHEPFILQDDYHLWVNAGSCGGAIGDPRAALAVLDWRNGRWEAHIERVAYDLDQADAAALRSGMPFAAELAASRRRAQWFTIPD